VIPVLYFHGFASSPDSAKVRGLRALLERDGIVLDVPDLNVPSFERLDFDAIVDKGVVCGRANPPRAIAGSSFGALIALQVARRGIAAPIVLIAPALGVVDLWPAHIPPGDPVSVFNHARNAKAPIHRAFFERVATVDVDRQPPSHRVTVIMGRRDENVPFARVEGVWRAWEASGRLAPGSRFIEIPDGDHGLTEFVDVIAAEIRSALSSLAHARDDTQLMS